MQVGQPTPFVMATPDPLFSQRILVTGPARSGKSEWAEQLAVQSGKAVVYLATAQIDETDVEWQARIERHRQRRPPTWITQHVPFELATAIATASPDQCLLIDSLGTWLANQLEQDESEWHQTQEQLFNALRQTPSSIILVAEETGWGVVPAYPLGRQFRDRLGQLVRQVGTIVEVTYLVTAGHVLNLSQLGTPLDRRSLQELDQS